MPIIVRAPVAFGSRLAICSNSSAGLLEAALRVEDLADGRVRRRLEGWTCNSFRQACSALRHVAHATCRLGRPPRAAPGCQVRRPGEPGSAPWRRPGFPLAMSMATSPAKRRRRVPVQCERPRVGGTRRRAVFFVATAMAPARLCASADCGGAPSAATFWWLRAPWRHSPPQPVEVGPRRAPGRAWQRASTFLGCLRTTSSAASQRRFRRTASAFRVACQSDLGDLEQGVGRRRIEPEDFVEGLQRLFRVLLLQVEHADRVLRGRQPRRRRRCRLRPDQRFVELAVRGEELGLEEQDAGIRRLLRQHLVDPLLRLVFPPVRELPPGKQDRGRHVGVLVLDAARSGAGWPRRSGRCAGCTSASVSLGAAAGEESASVRNGASASFGLPVQRRTRPAPCSRPRSSAAARVLPSPSASAFATSPLAQ